MRYPFKVYVACSLTHATQEFRDEVERFKKALGSICNVLCFMGCGTLAPPHQVYDWDIHGCVYNSDLVVAVCDHPSTGLGYELGTQIEARRKPVLMVAHEKSIVTDLILDMRQPGVSFHRYENFHSDVFSLVAKKLEAMHKELSVSFLFPEAFDVEGKAA